MHHQARKTYRQPTVMPRLWNVCPPTDSTTVESEWAENLPLNSGSPWRWFGPYLGTFDSVQRHFPLSQLGGRGRVLLISTQQRLLPPPLVHRNQPPKTVSYKYQQRWHWETMVWSKEACLHFLCSTSTFWIVFAFYFHRTSISNTGPVLNTQVKTLTAF